MQKRARIEQALRRKYPEQVVIVTAAASGRANAMAVGWTMIASDDPPMFALGIDSSSYTYQLIRASRQFVVAFPSETMAEAALFVGSTHGSPNRDKLGESGLALQHSAQVQAPLLRDAVANFECKLVSIAKPGDCPILFGQVVAAHVNTRTSARRLYTVAPGHRLGGVRAVASRPDAPRKARCR